MKHHPTEVYDTIRDGLSFGSTTKITHAYKRDGSPCSIGKSRAMTVTRTIDGILYYCHRCHETSIIKNSELSPVNVIALLDYKKHKEEQRAPRRSGSLPLTVPFHHRDFPAEAVTYLRQYAIEPHWFTRLEVEWSKDLQRIVFPCIVPIRNHDDDAVAFKTVGYAARCPYNHTPEQRVKLNRPKWITRKIATFADRMYFQTNPNYGLRNCTPLIITEDCLSAILAHKASGASAGGDAIALLGSSLSYSLLLNYKNSPIILWLDPDMHAKAAKYVSRFSALGFRITAIKSCKDPKEYSTLRAIRKVNHALLRAAG